MKDLPTRLRHSLQEGVLYELETLFFEGDEQKAPGWCALVYRLPHGSQVLRDRIREAYGFGSTEELAIEGCLDELWKQRLPLPPTGALPLKVHPSLWRWEPVEPRPWRDLAEEPCWGKEGKQIMQAGRG